MDHSSLSAVIQPIPYPASMFVLEIGARSDGLNKSSHCPYFHSCCHTLVEATKFVRQDLSLVTLLG